MCTVVTYLGPSQNSEGKIFYPQKPRILGPKAPSRDPKTPSLDRFSIFLRSKKSLKKIEARGFWDFSLKKREKSLDRLTAIEFDLLKIENSFDRLTAIYFDQIWSKFDHGSGVFWTPSELKIDRGSGFFLGFFKFLNFLFFLLFFGKKVGVGKGVKLKFTNFSTVSKKWNFLLLFS